MVCPIENNEEIGNRPVCDEDLRTVYDKFIAMPKYLSISSIVVASMILPRITNGDGFSVGNAGQIRLLLSLAPIPRDYLDSVISTAKGNTKP